MLFIKPEVIESKIKTLTNLLESKEPFDIFIEKGYSEYEDTEYLYIYFSNKGIEEGFNTIELEILNHMADNEQLEIKDFQSEKYQEYIPEVIKHIKSYIKYRISKLKIDLSRSRSELKNYNF